MRGLDKYNMRSRTETLTHPRSFCGTLVKQDTITRALRVFGAGQSAEHFQGGSLRMANNTLCQAALHRDNGGHTAICRPCPAQATFAPEERIHPTQPPDRHYGKDRTIQHGTQNTTDITFPTHEGRFVLRPRGPWPRISRSRTGAMGENGGTILDSLHPNTTTRTIRQQTRRVFSSVPSKNVRE